MWKAIQWMVLHKQKRIQWKYVEPSANGLWGLSYLAPGWSVPSLGGGAHWPGWLGLGWLAWCGHLKRPNSIMNVLCLRFAFEKHIKMVQKRLKIKTSLFQLSASIKVPWSASRLRDYTFNGTITSSNAQKSSCQLMCAQSPIWTPKVAS